MTDCPDFKKKISSSLKQKKSFVKKVFKATWDSESESEDEVDTANVCFMANTPKVTTEPYDDDSEISKELLLQAFIELSESFDSKKEDCLKLKKENEMLKNQIAISSKEKDELSSTLISTQRDFDAYRVTCKAKYLKIDENEFSMLKTRINDLGNVLKECAFNNTCLLYTSPSPRDS